MTKNTKKYIAALRAAKVMGIKLLSDADEMYASLASVSYAWDSKVGEWAYAAPQVSRDGTPGLIRIRLNCNLNELDMHVRALERTFVSLGWVLIDKSEPYPNVRKGTGVRVYLSVMADGGLR